MTIVQRLVLLVGIALAGLLALVGTALNQMGQVYETTNYGNENSIPSILVLDKAILEFSRLRVRSYRAVMNQGSG